MVRSGLSGRGEAWSGKAGEVRSGEALLGKASLGLVWPARNGAVGSVTARLVRLRQASLGAASQGIARSGSQGKLWFGNASRGGAGKANGAAMVPPLFHGDQK